MGTWILVVLFLRPHPNHDELVFARVPLASLADCNEARANYVPDTVDEDGDRVLSTGCIRMRLEKKELL